MIVVDADATPNIKDIIEVAYKNNTEITLVSDTSHMIESDYANVITLSKGSQNVDMYIINNLTSRDILITQDIGLASLALSITKKVMNTKGNLYKEETIDQMMFERHLNKLSNFSCVKHKKRTNEDTKNMIKLLEELIKRSK